MWRTQLQACDALSDFNRYVVPAMRSQGDVFLKMAASEAKRRGYMANKEKGCYE